MRAQIGLGLILALVAGAVVLAWRISPAIGDAVDVRNDVADARARMVLPAEATRTALDLERRESEAAYAAIERAMEHEASIQRMQHDAAIRANVSTFAGASMTLTLGLAPILLLAWFAMFLWNRRAPLVWADETGALPVSRSFLTARPHLAFEQTAELAAARLLASVERQRAMGPQVPQHYAPQYAPRITLKNEGVAPLALEAGTPAAVPTFSELVMRGEIGPGKPLLIGYGEDGTAVTIQRSSMAAMIIAGVSGAGKTTSVRSMLGQLALEEGARFAIVDPHGNVKDRDKSLLGTTAPLSGAYFCQPAASTDSAGRVISLVERELERRLLGGDWRGPLILVIDEWTKVMRQVGPSLEELLESIASEGRKVGVFALAIGQTFNSKRTGGTETRDTFGAKLVHRISPPQARMLLPGLDLPPTLALATGEAILYRVSDGDVIRLRVPNTTERDLASLAGLLPPPSTTTTASTTNPPPFSMVSEAEAEAEAEAARWNGLWPEEETHQETIAVESELVPFAQSATRDELRAAVVERIHAAAQEQRKLPITATIQELWGESAGRPFQRARADLGAILAEIEEQGLLLAGSDPTLSQEHAIVET